MNLNEIERDAHATRVYAVGDVHGRLDLLRLIESAIENDIEARPTAVPVICYLGDYVDRGPESAGAIEYLANAPTDKARRVFLKGNHEDRMLAFLDNPAGNGPGWMKFGGREALSSYGLADDMIGAGDWQALRDALSEALPAAHLAFLQTLQLAWRWGTYLFVHAGVDPARPMIEQDAHDLMWIREPFLSSDRDFGCVVVHGHVIQPHPVYRSNRIGLDTGAYQSGILTCGVFDDGGVRMLQAQ